MKLQNKKTGEFGDLLTTQKDITVIIGNGTSEVSISTYNSLNELNKEWGDVADINVTNIPYIKDKKMCKAVRAWADVNDAMVLKYNHDENSLDDIYRNTITFNMGLGLEDGRKYTITELCGE